MKVQRSDDDWSLLREGWLKIPLGADPAHAGPTWETFSENFGRHLECTSAYVKCRVSDRRTVERIVTQLTVRSLGPMARQGNHALDRGRMEASADLLIAIEAAMGADRRNVSVDPGHWNVRARRDRLPVLHGKGRQMSGKTDRIKGRAKQAAGVLVGDKSLENEGKVDRAGGRIKEAAEAVVDKLKSAVKRKK